MIVTTSVPQRQAGSQLLQDSQFLARTYQARPYKSQGSRLRPSSVNSRAFPCGPRFRLRRDYDAVVFPPFGFNR